MIVLGAGMSGCLFGALNKDAIIFEAQNEIPDNHHAVLRFKDDKISKATGIPFKKVKVQKTIWYDNKECKPSPRLSNLYSIKVTNKILNRSIDDISTSERFVAPSDFSNILADMCKTRINLSCNVTKIDLDNIHYINLDGDKIIVKFMCRSNTPIISTIPMPILSKIIGFDMKQQFNFQPIKTTRVKVKDCDVYQTIYYPEPITDVYRATLTGEDLIIERMVKGSLDTFDINYVLDSFGISDNQISEVKDKEQKYGKISPINNFMRKNFMFTATRDYGIYSLGRFACWRNILMDDVYDDIFKIKNMFLQDIYDIKARFV